MSRYLRAAGLLPHPDARDDLRRGHVGLQPGQLVDPVRQRVEHLRVVEPLRGGQVPLLAGDGVQVGQRLGQAAELVLQHHLHLRVRQARGAPVHPVAELGRDVERLGVAGQLILVDQPGQVLVDHVIRRPDGPALLQPVEEDLGERRQVPGMEPGLARPGLHGGELADQVAPAGQRVGVTRVRVRQRERGHQVPGGVPAYFGRGPLPAAARLRRRGQAVVQPERAQHAVQIEERQVRGVPGLIIPEGAVEQFHVAHRQRGGPARRAVRRVAARDRLALARWPVPRQRGPWPFPHRGRSSGPARPPRAPAPSRISASRRLILIGPLIGLGRPGPSAFATSEILCPATAPPTILSS